MRKLIMLVIALALGLTAMPVYAGPSTKTNTATAPVRERPALGAKSVTVPEEYMALYDSYRDWKPETEREPFANSITNWALHAQYVAGITGIKAIRNWLFTRSEDHIRQLALANKDEIKHMFGKVFNLRGMHIVFAQAYSPDTDGIYRSWYNCVAETLRKDANPPAEPDDVLSEVNWNEKAKTGANGECKEIFTTLATYYGVAELSPDDLTAIGFLSRRFEANRLSQKFVSAEFLRKLVHDIFDGDE